MIALLTNIYSIFYFYWIYIAVAATLLIVLYLINEKEKAERLLAAKEMFLATMCHEIRTPLNAVVGMTYLLIEENPRPEQAEHLNAMKFSAEHLLLLVNDVLECNKVKSGKVTFEEIDFNLKDLVSSIRHSHAWRADEKGIQLKVHFDPQTPETVLGDPVRLAQVLNNLVSNAIKFTQQGSVVIDVNVEQQTREHAVVGFSVIDTGIGIPQDKLEYIFENYTQASADTTRKFGGTGLGLAIIRQLLKLQNSNICVESIEGKGSKFSFALKMKKKAGRAPMYPGTPGSGNHQEVSYTSLKDKHIRLLVVEDNPVNQKVVYGFLTRWGIKPDFADNGREALGMIIKEEYDIILADLQMPEMDGYELAKILRSLEGSYYQNVPLIAMSASCATEVKNKIMAVGMNDYVSKPFNPAELYQKISEYVNHINPYIMNVSTEKTIEALPGEVINYAKLVKMAFGHEELQNELTQIYIEAFEKFPDHFREALLSGNAEELDFVIHKLKPSMRVLEVFQLEKELKHAEELLSHRADHLLMEKSIRRVSSLCSEIVSALQVHLPLAVMQ